MKNINLYLILFFLPFNLWSMDDSIVLSTIFAPAPLLELHQETTWKNDCISFIKRAALPLTCYFYYNIKQNDILIDVQKHPYITTLSLYALAHYSMYLILENQQKKLDKEIIDMMQHIFHLLIIGHGIYNKITIFSYSEHKISTTLSPSALTTLQLFLYKAYNTWFILFSYYQEHYKNKPLYAYQMNQVDAFEVLQACSHEPDILPLITNFYDKHNRTYDYEPILNCLEIKLKLINHKLIQALPAQYQSNDGK